VDEAGGGGPIAHLEPLAKKLNAKLGTATLTATVPGAGTLVLGGSGITKVSKRAKAAGAVKLTVKATGKASRTLAASGSTTVVAKVTFTPSGGEPRTRTVKVPLKLTR
jgi:hypothetical protein